MTSDMEKAQKYADDEWLKVVRAYLKFLDKLIECRKNQLFFKQKGDMWYLGYLLSKDTEEYDIEEILDEIREGLEDGRLINGK